MSSENVTAILEKSKKLKNVLKKHCGSALAAAKSQVIILYSVKQDTFNT